MRRLIDMYKLVISLVTVLFLAGGYFYFVPGSSDVNFTQYLPESLTRLFKEGETVELSVDQSDLTPLEEIVSQPIDAAQPQKDRVETKLDESVAKSTASSDKESVAVSTDHISEVLVTAEEQMANDTSNDASTNVTIAANQSSDIVKLESKLVEMNTSISDLDAENEKLQQRFKEMLRKNKDLALTLNRLEEKLKTPN